MKYLNSEKDLDKIKNHIDSICVSIYQLSNNVNKEKLTSAIDNFKKTNFDGIPIKLESFHGMDITTEELSKKISHVEKGKVKDFSKKIIPNVDNLLAIGLCKLNSNKIDNVGDYMIIVTKQVESKESISAKIDKILEFNVQSNAFTKIYVKSPKDLLEERNLEKNLSKLNLLENKLIAKCICERCDFKLKSEVASDVSVKSNSLPTPYKTFNIKTYTIDGDYIKVCVDDGHFISKKEESLPLFLDPINGINIAKPKDTKSISMKLFTSKGNVVTNEESVDYDDDEILKKCYERSKKLDWNVSLDTILSNRCNHLKQQKNFNIGDKFNIKYWNCSF